MSLLKIEKHGLVNGHECIDNINNNIRPNFGVQRMPFHLIFVCIFFGCHVHKKGTQKKNNNKLFHRIFILLKFTCGCNCTAQSDYASSDLIIFHRNNLNRRPANKLPILMPFIIILFESEVPLLELEIYRYVHCVHSERQKKRTKTKQAAKIYKGKERRKKK